MVSLWLDSLQVCFIYYLIYRFVPMRHKYKKVSELETGNQTRSNVIRNFLTSIIKHGSITTTPKRAKVIVSEVNHFFSHLLRILTQYDENSAKREMVRFLEKTLWTDTEGKKVMSEYIVKYKEVPNKTNFVTMYKTTLRKGDGVQNVLVRLD